MQLSLSEQLAGVAGPLTDADSGLSEAEAADRLQRLGPNVLPGDASEHPLTILISQFRSPLVLILVAAAVISFAVGEIGEALIITIIVLTSSGLSFFQEIRASTAMRALRARLATSVSVRRDRRSISIPMSGVVPGDVLELTGGSLVGADALLVDSTDLQVDEAVITGESFPVAKSAAPAAAVSDESNVVHMGTSVRSGTARAVVLTTGAETQFGKIAALAGGREHETGFARGIRRFGMLMTQIMLVIIAVILPINILLGRPLLESVLFSAALAVGLTPELLPAIVTVTLARGAQQLARAGVLVRRLVAIENLGAMNVLCTDKTGTLTVGAIALTQALDVDGRPSPDVRRWATLNASLQIGLPNPIDEAILSAAPTVDVGAYRRCDEIPYDFERKRLSVLVAGGGRMTLVCKGAPEPVLSVCSRVATAEGAALDLSEERLAAELERLRTWGDDGLRVLAVAIRSVDSEHCGFADEQDMTLIGYLLFADQLKPEIAEVVAGLRRVGIGLKMITGDSRHVAVHVAREIGLRTDKLLTGRDLSGLGDRALAHRIGRVDVFAEVTPDQKERIVAALRNRHHVVGYLGDGINDAPALRASDIAISVDTAVDAARDAADVVLLKRDLKVLHNGIVLGRASFANTLKYIAITTSSNLGNMISMAVMSLFLPFLPMLAKQILVNNLLTDLPLIAISADRVDEELLVRAGRWDFHALLRSMLGFGLVSSAFDALTFVMLLFVFSANEPTFQTSWFIVSLLTELAIIAVMRTRKPFHLSSPAPLLAWVAAGVAAVALALPYTPLAAPLGFVPLDLDLLVTGVAIVCGYFIASEALKLRINRQRPSRHHKTGIKP